VSTVFDNFFTLSRGIWVVIMISAGLRFVCPAFAIFVPVADGSKFGKPIFAVLAAGCLATVRGQLSAILVAVVTRAGGVSKLVVLVVSVELSVFITNGVMR
jgi:hypothetical protein